MSGSGRGRGWLRLGQNTVQTKPPGVDLPKTLPEEKSQDDLIELFNLLNVEDDGIAVNNKIFHIRNEFMKKGNDINIIRESVESIHEECLVNDNFAKKFLLFISSAHFEYKQKSQEQILWRDTVRKSFITLLQTDFEDGQRNREHFPTKFYNGVKLCSNFFYNISKFQSKVYPMLEKIAILGYIKLLLDYDTPRDTQMITQLVCRHSSIITEILDDETCQLHKELFNKLKLMLIAGSSLPESQRILVFFIYELLTTRFNLTENQLEFYRSNMNDVDFSEILGLVNDLPQPVANFKERNNRQISEEQINHNSDRNGTNKSFTHPPPDQSYKVCEENTSCSSSEQEFKHSVRLGISEEQQRYKSNEFKSRPKENFYVPNKDYLRDHPNDGLSTPERIGRPILGVGARLKKM